MAKDLLRERLAKYIPPKEQWTPVDEALYGVDDIYNVPEEKAKKLRTNAIRYAFRHHYDNNRFYHEYCKDRNVTPDDIKTEEDFVKIPLIPDTTFKSYPDIEHDGKDKFISWLANIYTGELPEVKIDKKNPSYDDVLNAFWQQKGVWITFSTTTTGRCTFLPRDQLTRSRDMFSTGYHAINFLLDIHNKETLAPYTDKEIGIIAAIPNPIKTMHMARVLEGVFFGVFEGCEKIFLVDAPVSPDLIKIYISGEAHKIRDRIVLGASAISQKAFVSKCMKDLKKWEKEKKRAIFFGFPFAINDVLSTIEKKGLKFNLLSAEMYTVGGWKIPTGALSAGGLREKSNRVFEVPESRYRDIYAMTELNAYALECEHHYKHIPYLLKSFVVDDELDSLPYGSEGRFAFLDPLANSYPGFIVTNDRVKLLEHCPECDRQGFVLEPEIKRMVGAPPKGCAAAFEKALSRAERGKGE